MAQPLSETFLTGLQCLRCGQFFQPDSVEYVCPCRPNLGSDLGHLDAVYDYEAVAAMRKGDSGGGKSGAMARPLPTPPVRSLLRHSSPSKLSSDGGHCCRYVQNLFHHYPLETLLCYPPVVSPTRWG